MVRLVVSPIPKYGERFESQYRYEAPPSDFHLNLNLFKHALQRLCMDIVSIRIGKIAYTYVWQIEYIHICMYRTMPLCTTQCRTMSYNVVQCRALLYNACSWHASALPGHHTEYNSYEATILRVTLSYNVLHFFLSQHCVQFFNHATNSIGPTQ